MLTARPQLNVWLIVSYLRKRSALHLTSKVGVHALRLTLWGRDLCGGRSSRGIPDTAHVGAVSLHTRVDSEGTPYFIMYEINTADEEVVARHLPRCSSTLAHFVSRRSDATVSLNASQLKRHIRQMRIPLHWTALLLCFVVVAPLAVEALLRLYVTYVTKRDHLFRSDVQTGWSNAPNL
jgi:hypothetical protein